MEILVRDEQLLVIDKPSGVLAQPDHSGDPDVLTKGKAIVADREGVKDPFLGLVHRLDRPTSGVMVLARTSSAARRLSKQFRERTAEKTYLALVEGRLRGVGTWMDTIAKPDRQPKRVSPDHPEGKHAELSWQALGRNSGRTLIRCQLRTGRPHQIRLQASARGHPVVGDTRYGAENKLSGGAITLHHTILRVEHPERDRVQTFIAPLPNQWDDLLSTPMRETVEKLLDRATMQ
jgi:tRNA pseudouridine32 synthase/23S rRNA pseudouridine746 synthase/23S rRNA pseudouridine1911/1915/1917 synthase